MQNMTTTNPTPGTTCHENGLVTLCLSKEALQILEDGHYSADMVRQTALNERREHRMKAHLQDGSLARSGDAKRQPIGPFQDDFSRLGLIPRFRNLRLKLKLIQRWLQQRNIFAGGGQNVR